MTDGQLIAKLYEIQIEHHEVDDTDTHIEILVSSGAASIESWTDAFFAAHVTDVVDAAQYMAGVLARIGLWAVNYTLAEQRQHGCHGYAWEDARAADGEFSAVRHPMFADVCGISMPQTLLKPSNDWTDPPAMWICIPAARLKVWKGLLNQWMRIVREEIAGCHGSLERALDDPNEPRFYPVAVPEPESVA